MNREVASIPQLHAGPGERHSATGAASDVQINCPIPLSKKSRRAAVSAYGPSVSVYFLGSLLQSDGSRAALLQVEHNGVVRPLTYNLGISFPACVCIPGISFSVSGISDDGNCLYVQHDD